MKKEQTCMYCGSKTNNSNVCANCFAKRKLIRELQGMVRAAQEEVRKYPCDFCERRNKIEFCSRCPATPKRR